MTIIELFRKVGRIPVHVRYEYGYIRILIIRTISYFINHTPNVWLFLERGVDAQDNAWHLFKYMEREHPEIPVRFAITKNSPDREANLKGYERCLINYNSFEYYKFLFHAEAIVSTHVDTFTPDSRYSKRIRESRSKLRAKIVFLQHGIIHNGICPEFVYPNYNIDLFICGAKTEQEILDGYLNFPKGHLVYTGLARYDKLLECTPKKQILIMPTWRKKFNHVDDDTFRHSDFYILYNNLLRDKRLIDSLRRYGYLLKFYPHYEFQKYIHLFDSVNNDSIKVVKFGEQRVQELLKESSVLVTDYSSIFFDFLYMGKPLIFYQFDINDFQTYQYGKCHYEYSDLGVVATTTAEVVDVIVSMIKNNCVLGKKYTNMINKLFEYRDTYNCHRIYDNIIRILSEK